MAASKCVFMKLRKAKNCSKEILTSVKMFVFNDWFPLEFFSHTIFL